MADLEPPALEWQAVTWTPTGGRTVLQDVSLSAPAGSVTYLAGESGCGKSTLLKMPSRLIEPNAGAVRIVGRDVREWDVRSLRRHVVYVSQRPIALGETVGADLKIPLDWHGLPGSEDLLRQALVTAHLPELSLEQTTRGLSEGQLSRLGLARALALQPKVLLLDEPTAALDPNSAQSILVSLGSWAQASQATIICATHRLLERGALPGRLAVIVQGHLWGPYSDVELTEAKLPQAVADFLRQTETAG